MSAVGVFQMYIMSRMAQAEETVPVVEEPADQPTSETQGDTQTLHDDEAWFAYRHGCG